MSSSGEAMARAREIVENAECAAQWEIPDGEFQSCLERQIATALREQAEETERLREGLKAILEQAERGEDSVHTRRILRYARAALSGKTP
jgi:hypothetical protein